MDEQGEILSQYSSLRSSFPPDPFLCTLTRIRYIPTVSGSSFHISRLLSQSRSYEEVYYVINFYFGSAYLFHNI